MAPLANRSSTPATAEKLQIIRIQRTNLCICLLPSLLNSTSPLNRTLPFGRIIDTDRPRRRCKPTIRNLNCAEYVRPALSKDVDTYFRSSNSYVRWLPDIYPTPLH